LTQIRIQIDSGFESASISVHLWLTSDFAVV
jgi:hypothetical protein